MRKWHYVWLMLAVIGLDVATKQWVIHTLSLGKVRPVVQGFNITLAHNAGAAFSFLAQEDGWQRGFLTGVALAVSIGFSVWLKRTPLLHRWTCMGLSLIIGGAIGNVIDRLYYGYVIDFLDFYLGKHHWPAFNVADSAVCLGVFCLCIGMMRGEG